MKRTHLLGILATATCTGAALSQESRTTDTPPITVPKAPAKPVKPATPDDLLLAQLSSLQVRLKDNGNFELERPRLQQLWHWVLAWKPVAEADLYRSIFTTLRCMEFAGTCEGPTRQAGWKLLNTHPDFASAAAFVWHPKKDQIPEALALGLTLEKKRPKDFEKFANLAAAMCAVRDRPLAMQLNENVVQAPPATDLFEFFVATNGGGAWPVNSTPPELLVFVVDAAASVDELAWAQSRYFKDAMVGNRYQEINYDINHFTMGTPKKISEEGAFNLPNIKRWGGVCVDQAYFASEVGKAIGIPSVYVTAEGTDVGHAWVGFLRAQGGRILWDFSAGRHDEYKRIRGEIVNPQFGGVMSDGEIAVLTEALTLNESVRRKAAALAEGAVEMREARRRKIEWPVVIAGLEPPKGKKARTLTVSSELELIEAAVKLYPSCPQAWDAVCDLARDGDLGDKERERWASKVTELCGQKFPDFSSKILAILVKSVKDIEVQSNLWDSMARQFQTRPDLAADARLAQASLWEKAKNPDRALRAYKSIIDNLLNEGAFAFVALERCEDLYNRNGAAQEVIPMYKAAFRRVQRPGQMNRESMASSGWYQIGSRYAQLLEENEQFNEAQNVRMQINIRE